MAKKKKDTVDIMEKDQAAVGLTVLQTVDVPVGKLRLVDAFRGRAEPVAEENVYDLAYSIYTQGQLQPIQVRPYGSTDEYEVIFGNTRTRAGQLLKEGFDYDDTDGKEEGKKTKPVPPHPDFTMRCEVVECSEQEAIRRNYTENIRRNNLTAWDQAVIHQQLREDGMSDTEIGKLMGFAHSAAVNRIKKLLDCPEEVQQLVHRKEMTLAAAVELASVKDSDDQESIMKIVHETLEEAKKNKKQDQEKKEDEVRSIGLSLLSEAKKKYEKAKKEAAAQQPQEGQQQPDTTDPVTQDGSTVDPTTGTPRTPNNEPVEKPKRGRGRQAANPGATPITLAQAKEGLNKILAASEVPQTVKDTVSMFLQYLTGGENEIALVKFLNLNVKDAMPPEGWEMGPDGGLTRVQETVNA